jgi:hypothetical protein
LKRLALATAAKVTRKKLASKAMLRLTGSSSSSRMSARTTSHAYTASWTKPPKA